MGMVDKFDSGWQAWQEWGETEWSTTMMMMMIVRKKKYLRSCFRPHCDPSRLLLRLPGDSRRSSRIRRVGMWGWSWRSRSGAPLWVTWVRWDERFFFSILGGEGVWVEYSIVCIVSWGVASSLLVSSRPVSSLVSRLAVVSKVKALSSNMMITD